MRLCFDEYMHARQRLIVWVLVQTRAHLLKYERSVISCEAFATQQQSTHLLAS
jgi:hypothetical protein